MTYNKVRTWLYKEGQEFEAVTGGWKGRQLYTMYGDNPQNTGTFIKHDTYLEYGSPTGDTSVGCFLTTNKIDLTKYSTLVVDREIVDWNGYYVSGDSGWNGHAFDTVYIFDTPTPQVEYGNSYKPTSLHNRDLIGQKPAGVYPKRETLNLNVASRTTSHYIGVAGEASDSSATFINCNLYNMYLETNVTAVTHTVNGKTINVQVNNADGLVTYSKVDIIVGGKVVKTFTGAELSSTMSYTLTSVNTLHNIVSIRATYSQGGGPEDIVGVDFDMVDESVQGMPFRNGIDENTVFCLRGDCYSDISFAPKQVTNHGTSIIDDSSLFGKAIYFSADTTNNKITSTDGFAIDPSSDITFEWWEYSLGDNSNAALFTNRITPNDYWAKCIMFGYKGIKLAVGNTKTTWDISTVDHKDRVNNEWVHWALVKQGNVYITYRNGVTFSMHSAAASFGKTEGNALTIGAWIRKTQDDSSCGYNAYISDFKISNVARYSKEFTPDRRPSTSVNITDLVNNNGVLSCSIYQGSVMDTISKVDITVNGNVVESKTNNFYNISYEIDDTLFKVGSNKIEVRAYYFNNCYVSKSYIVTKPLVLEEFEPLTKLNADAGLGAIKTRISEINNAHKILTNNLKNILSSKGIETQETRLSQIIKEINKQFDVYLEAEEKLEEKENVTKQKLVDLMLENGYSITGEEEIEELLELLKESNINPYKIEKIFCGHNVTFIVYNTGEVYGTGLNSYGSLGLGDTNARLSFTLIPNMTDVKQIEGGNQHTAILKNDGTVWTSGKNGYGQLGLGNTTDKTTFTKTSITDVKQIACGENFTFAVKNDGSLWACGLNTSSQLGLDNYSNKTSFTKITKNINNDVKEVFCGFNHTFIIKNDGSVYACGFNTYGALGLNNTSTKTSFTKVTTNISDVKSFACGESHTIMLKNDGSVWATGGSYNGQLGLGTSGNNTDKYVFTQVTKNVNNDVKQIAAGYNCSLIIKNDGSLWGCGQNDGLLGQNNTTKQVYFTKATININDDVKSMTCCNIHAAILKNNSAVFVAGRGDNGQLGVGSNTTTYQTVYIPAPSPK